MLKGISLRPLDQAETPRVTVAQADSALKNKIDVIMFFCPASIGQDTQAARHTQMPDQGAALGVEKKVLSPATNLVYGSADAFAL
jgi:hypothetical protein